MKILIAEDEKMARFALRASLSAWGHEVLEAADGKDALRILAEDNSPKLAILDWAMPVLNGIDVCRKVRSAGNEEYTYIILLTAKDASEDMIEGFDAGVDDYIIKPFEPRELKARIAAACRILDLHSELRQARDRAERSRLEVMHLNENLEAMVEDRTTAIHRLLSQKDRFVSQLGHDLKTPLSPMVAMLPVLNDYMSNEEGSEILTVIMDNVEYMRRLVESTVELARMNTEKFELNVVQFDCGEEIASILSSMESMFRESGIDVTNTVELQTMVMADPLRIREMMHNILANAIKYMGGPGRLAISASCETGSVVISVSDTGIGMTEDEIANAFDEFYKADNSRHDRSSVGLGLSICKRIIEKHGGRIWIESQGRWQGTTISFSLQAVDSQKPGEKENA